MPLLESSKNHFYNFLFRLKGNLITWFKKYCRCNANIEVVFLSFKISLLFSMKDKVPFDLRSYVVYKFVCGSCKTLYLGQTKRHLPTRIKKHMETDKKSHEYKHLTESP